MTASVRQIREGLWGDDRPLDARQSALRAAHQAGSDEGERIGYVAGFRWGAVCGATVGALLTLAGALLWRALS